MISEAEIQRWKERVPAAVAERRFGIGIACPKCWRPLGSAHNLTRCSWRHELDGNPDAAAGIRIVLTAHGLESLEGQIFPAKKGDPMPGVG